MQRPPTPRPWGGDMPPPPSPAGTPLGAWVRILCGGAADSNPPSRGEAYSLTPPNGGETIREDPRGGARSSYPCIRGSASQPSNPRPRGEAYPPTLRIGGEDWGNTARSNTHAAPYPAPLSRDNGIRDKGMGIPRGIRDTGIRDMGYRDTDTGYRDTGYGIQGYGIQRMTG